MQSSLPPMMAACNSSCRPGTLTRAPLCSKKSTWGTDARISAALSAVWPMELAAFGSASASARTLSCARLPCVATRTIKGTRCSPKTAFGALDKRRLFGDTPFLMDSMVFAIVVDAGAALTLLDSQAAAKLADAITFTNVLLSKIYASSSMVINCCQRRRAKSLAGHILAIDETHLHLSVCCHLTAHTAPRTVSATISGWPSLPSPW